MAGERTIGGWVSSGGGRKGLSGDWRAGGEGLWGERAGERRGRDFCYFKKLFQIQILESVFIHSMAGFSCKVELCCFIVLNLMMIPPWIPDFLKKGSLKNILNLNMVVLNSLAI